MKNFKNVFFISLSTVILSNCSARREFVSLSPSLQKEIGSTDIYAEEAQKRLQADIESSNISVSTGGGLLFSLVDCAIMAYRENCANDTLSELQKDFEKANVQEKFKAKLNSTFKETNWLHVNQINFIKEINKNLKEDILKNAQTDSVLVSKLDYRFNPVMDTLKGTLYVNLYPTSFKLQKMINVENPQEKSILTFKVSAAKSLPKAGKDMEENVKTWAENEGNLLKDALDETLNQVFLDVEKILRDPSNLPED